MSSVESGQRPPELTRKKSLGAAKTSAQKSWSVGIGVSKHVTVVSVVIGNCARKRSKSIVRANESSRTFSAIKRLISLSAAKVIVKRQRRLLNWKKLQRT